jgi:hypothetical protein
MDFFFNLPISKLLYDAAYLAKNLLKKVNIYFDISEGSILNVHFQRASVFLLIYPIFLKASSQS